jgi:predicted transglutaminase-like protease
MNSSLFCKVPVLEETLSELKCAHIRYARTHSSSEKKIVIIEIITLLNEELLSREDVKGTQIAASCSRALLVWEKLLSDLNQ